jgi:DNA-directed RNA polymerase specialized sigma24 family protein
LDEPKLADLSDEHLIQHLVRARDAGDHEQFKLSIDLLVYRRYDHIVGKVGLKVPEQDVEDVAMNAITSAIGSFDFRGTTMGEFVSGLNTITERRIADYHRHREREAKDEGLGGDRDEDSHGIEPQESQRETGGVALRMVVDQVISGRSAAHQKVIRLRIDGHGAKETAALVNEQGSGDGGSGGDPPPMTPANVDQIFSRFKRDLRAAIEQSGGF